MPGMLLRRPELKNRGWTNVLIEKFLAEPDETVPNRRYPGAPLINLYRCDRVANIETSDAYLAEKAKTEKRRQAARIALETKRQKMREYLDNLKIKVPIIEREELLRLAMNEFYSLGNSRSDSMSDERICVNYLRHCLTNYEQELRKISGKVGAKDAYYEIKEMVLDAIGDEYSWLMLECLEQSSRLSRMRLLEM